MVQLESKIEKKACELAYRLFGIKSSKLNTPGDTGFPDRIFWLPGGTPLFIEFKKPGETPEEHQSKKHKFLRTLGYRVEVIDNVRQLIETIIREVDTPQLSKKGRKILADARAWCVRI